jgi:hypothetical protein
MLDCIIDCASVGGTVTVSALETVRAKTKKKALNNEEL